MAAKAKDKAKELQNLVEEFKADIVEKDTHFDHLQKRNDELSTLLIKAKEDVIVESKPLNNSLIYWTPTTWWALKIFAWTLWKTSIKLTLAPLSSTLVLLQALSFRDRKAHV